MTPALPLAPLHREAGARFGHAGELELPFAYGPDPAVEYEAASRRVGLLDQSYRGVADVEGKEAAAFLERVVSSRVRDLVPGRGQPSCLLTPKGRVAGAFHLFRLAEDRFRLTFLEPLRPAFTAALGKYALLSEVEVRPCCGEVFLLRLRGPEAARVLAAAGVSRLPGEPLEVATGERIGDVPVAALRANAAPAAGYELWVEAPGLERAWTELAAAVEDAGGSLVGWEAAEAFRIEDGRPFYGVDYGEDHFPLEVGWEDAVSDGKCYVGQEIVARMRTYGHANRRLCRVVPAGDLPREEAGAFRGPILAGGEEAGQVTSSAYGFGRGCVVGLAVVKRRFFDRGDLRLAGRTPVCLEEPGRPPSRS